MKILQVCNYYSPVYGGSAEVPYRLSIELAKRGHDITIYTADYRNKISQEWLKSARELHIKVYGFKTWLNLASFQVTPGLVHVSNQIKNFDLIHMHNFRTFQNVLIHYYANKHHIPYVLQAHGSLPRIGAQKQLKKIYDELIGHRLLKDASRIISLTTKEAEQYRNMGVNKERIEIIPNGVNLSEYENLPQRGNFRAKWKIRESQKVILFLARIHKIKGPDLLAKAFSSISRDTADLKLVFAGPDNGYLAFMQKLTSELYIEDKVLFTGPLYGKDKLEAYVDADVYVLPSNYEAFSLSVIEAMACGTPVIVTDRCGIADIIVDKAGLVVPYDEKLLGSAISRMLSDENMRRECSIYSRSIVRKHFTWSKVVEQIDAVYESVRQ